MLNIPDDFLIVTTSSSEKHMTIKTVYPVRVQCPKKKREDLAYLRLVTFFVMKFPVSE